MVSRKGYLLSACAGIAIAIVIVLLLPADRGADTARRKKQVDVSIPAGQERSPDDVALANALDAEQTHEDRSKALHALGRHLSHGQVDQLRGLLKTTSLDPALRNDVAATLDRQHSPPPMLGEDLLAIWNRPDEDLMFRDYCLQWFSSCHAYSSCRQEIEAVLIATAKGSATDNTDASDRSPADRFGRSAFERGRSRLDRASPTSVGNINTNYPGTALISLQRLGRKHPHLARAAKAIAREAAGEGAVDPERTLNALQIAREAGDPAVLPAARRHAVDEAAPARLRMSAIGAIGTLGDKTDVPRLETLTQHRDQRLRQAAAAQLAELRRRLKLTASRKP